MQFYWRGHLNQQYCSYIYVPILLAKAAKSKKEGIKKTRQEKEVAKNGYGHNIHLVNWHK